jgi:hypothetical protein
MRTMSGIRLFKKRWIPCVRNHTSELVKLPKGKKIRKNMGSTESSKKSTLHIQGTSLG